jgi:hypothetical protein
VVQDAFDTRDYQGMDPSGRFAFFSQVVVDLASDRVAWRHDHTLLPVQTARHRVMRNAEAADGIELWDLLDGSTTLFPGILVGHIGMAERIAVQRDTSLDIIDSVRGRRVAVLSRENDVLSVVPSGATWLVLERAFEEDGRVGLQLVSPHPVPEDGMKRQHLQLPSGEPPLTPDSRHGDAFLAVDGSGALSVNLGRAVPGRGVRDRLRRGGLDLRRSGATLETPRLRWHPRLCQRRRVRHVSPSG